MPKKKATEGVKVSGKKWVSSHYRGNESNNEENLEVQVFAVEPAEITASLGLTINLGNYESARCDAGVTLPTYVEEIPEAYKKAWAIVEEELQRQVAGIKDK